MFIWNRVGSHTSAAIIGRLKEPRDVIYITVDWMEFRQRLLHYDCRCGFLEDGSWVGGPSFWPRTRVCVCVHTADRMWSRVSQTTSECECVFSVAGLSRISPALFLLSASLTLLWGLTLGESRMGQCSTSIQTSSVSTYWIFRLPLTVKKKKKKKERKLLKNPTLFDNEEYVFLLCFYNFWGRLSFIIWGC